MAERGHPLKKFAPRLIAESVVIFASIVLALIADDWRTARDERVAETEALEAIARDLASDAEDQRVFATRLGDQVTANQRLVQFLENGAPADSVLRELSDALNVWNYRPSYPTYRSLVGSGGFGLIQDPDVRDAIVDYHEEMIAYLDDLRATMRETADRASLAVEPFIQRARANSPSWEITGLHELGRLNSDREVIGSLVSAAAARDWLRIRIEDLFLPENARLHQVILTYLGDRR